MEDAEKTGRKIGILINPAAGGMLDPRALQKELTDLFQKSGTLLQYHVSAGKENLLEAAFQMLRDGCTALAVAGGDGSIHQILPALIGHDVPFGVLPLGSVNLLALEMGIPRDTTAAVKIIQKGKTRRMDAGVVNGRYFFQVLGTGLDAQVLRYVKTRWQKQWRTVYLPFVGMAAWFKNRVLPWHIRFDGKYFVRTSPGLIVANGAMYGGPFRLAPDVSNSDGELDLFILPKIPFGALVRFCIGVSTGCSVHTNMEHMRAKNFRIECEPLIEDVPVHVDGELGLAMPLEIQVKPRAISLLIP